MSGGRASGPTSTVFCFLRTNVEKTQIGRSSQGRENAKLMGGRGRGVKEPFLHDCCPLSGWKLEMEASLPPWPLLDSHHPAGGLVPCAGAQ